jgi:hypothetical protein
MIAPAAARNRQHSNGDQPTKSGAKNYASTSTYSCAFRRLSMLLMR